MNDAATQHTFTRLLLRWQDGDDNVLEELVPLLEKALRDIAHRFLHMESGNGLGKLRITELVNESWLRILAAKRRPKLDNRSHFRSYAALLIRHILVDQARNRLAQKRADEKDLLPLEEAWNVPQQKAREILALEDALSGLERLEPELALYAELNYFGGCTQEEMVGILGVSKSTVTRNLRIAIVWLKKEMGAMETEP